MHGNMRCNRRISKTLQNILTRSFVAASKMLWRINTPYQETVHRYD